MNSNFSLIYCILFGFLTGCAHDFRIVTKGEKLLALTPNDRVWVKSEICDRNGCQKNQENTILEEFKRKLIQRLSSSGIQFATNADEATIVLSVFSLYEIDYKNHQPRNFYLSFESKNELKEGEVLQVAIAKQYNGRFIQDDPDHSLALDYLFENIQVVNVNSRVARIPAEENAPNNQN